MSAMNGCQVHWNISARNFYFLLELVIPFLKGFPCIPCFLNWNRSYLSWNYNLKFLLVHWLSLIIMSMLEFVLLKIWKTDIICVKKKISCIHSWNKINTSHLALELILACRNFTYAKYVKHHMYVSMYQANIIKC